MLVRLKLEYGEIFWNAHTQNNIDTLEKIHRSPARFVVNDHRHTTSVTHNDMQSKLSWQTLETQRLQHQRIFLYRIKYNLLNIYLPQHLALSHAPEFETVIQINVSTYQHASIPNKMIRLHPSTLSIRP